MKFGSRMDVFLPPDSVLEVEVGDMVRGGETIMSRLSSHGQPDLNEQKS